MKQSRHPLFDLYDACELSDFTIEIDDPNREFRIQHSMSGIVG